LLGKSSSSVSPLFAPASVRRMPQRCLKDCLRDFVALTLVSIGK
jgi:hypothetical protein